MTIHQKGDYTMEVFVGAAIASFILLVPYLISKLFK